MFKPSIDPPKDNRSPLLRFRGVLKEYVAEERTDQNSNRRWTNVRFDFTDLEVIESTEPYPLPVTSLSVTFSEGANTRWAALASSMRKILPQPDIDLLVGKRQEWHWSPYPLRRRDDETGKWETVDQDTWQVVSVDGMTSLDAGKSLVDALLDVLDGKTEAEFNSAVFSDSSLKQMAGFTDVVEDIVNRKFLPMMEASNKASRDAEGRWSKNG